MCTPVDTDSYALSVARPLGFMCSALVHAAVPPRCRGDTALIATPRLGFEQNNSQPWKSGTSSLSYVGLDSLSLCQQVSNFRWQDQGTSIIAFVEIHDHHGCVFRHILVDEMASLREDV